MIIPRLKDRYRREGGQAIIIVVLALVVLLGMAGLAIDVGRIYVAQRQLQQAVDAAGLVAGQTLPSATSAANAAVAYSATQANAHGDMIAGNPTIQFQCNAFAAKNGAVCQSDSSGAACQPTNANAPGATILAPINVPLPPGTPTADTAGTCNAVKVSEGATVNTTFLSLFVPSLSSVSASSTVAAHGGVPHPIDIMLILDTTPSVRNNAVNGATVCPGISTPSKLDCEKSGATTLLENLWPCTPGNPCGTTNQPVDQVGLMVFPPLKKLSDRSKETNCTANELSSNDVHYDDSNNATGPTTVTGIKGKTNSSTTITALTSTTGIVAASGTGLLGAVVTGAGIPTNTTVVSVNGAGAGASITISKPATVTSANTVALTFSNISVNPTVNTNEPGPWTYEIVPFESSYSDWSTSAKMFQLQTDTLVSALGGQVSNGVVTYNKNCGIEAPSSTGAQGSSFVDALNAAQNAFAQLNDGHTHVIIFLGDGEGNYGPLYYSSVNNIINGQTIDNPPSPARSYPCQQTVQIAQQIVSTGVLIYGIGYWQGTSDEQTPCTGLIPGKGGDTAGQVTFFHSNEVANPGLFGPTESASDAANAGACSPAGLTGCWTIYNIASDPSKFYPDPSTSSLNSVFQSVALDLTDSRIIPGG
jgi:Flp pilus assembly protein TadG